MAERLAPGDYDQLRHFVAAGVSGALLLPFEAQDIGDDVIGL